MRDFGDENDFSHADIATTVAAPRSVVIRAIILNDDELRWLAGKIFCKEYITISKSAEGGNEYIAYILPVRKTANTDRYDPTDTLVIDESLLVTTDKHIEHEEYLTRADLADRWKEFTDNII